MGDASTNIVKLVVCKARAAYGSASYIDPYAYHTFCIIIILTNTINVTVQITNIMYNNLWCEAVTSENTNPIWAINKLYTIKSAGDKTYILHPTIHLQIRLIIFNLLILLTNI